MAANALIARIETAEPAYRVAPNNIDAEQALLGAILVNNDAYYRVSDFLEAAHFFEDLHRRIYEVATSLIKAGKVATPITLKTFLGDQDLRSEEHTSELQSRQYLVCRLLLEKKKLYTRSLLLYASRELGALRAI